MYLLDIYECFIVLFNNTSNISLQSISVKGIQSSSGNLLTKTTNKINRFENKFFNHRNNYNFFLPGLFTETGLFGQLNQTEFLIVFFLISCIKTPNLMIRHWYQTHIYKLRKQLLFSL